MSTKTKIKELSLKKLLLSKKKILFALLFLLSLSVLLTLTFWLLLSQRYFPNIAVASTDISFQTSPQAKSNLSSNLKSRIENPLILEYTPESSSSAQNLTQKFEINLSNLNTSQSLEDSLSEAWAYGHQKPYFSKVNLEVNPLLDDFIITQVTSIEKSINQPEVSSTLKIEAGQITVTPSQDGLILDEDALKEKITEYLNTGKVTNPTLPLKKVTPKLSYETASKIKTRLEQIKLSPLKLVYKDKSYTLTLDDILSLIDLENSQNSLAQINFAGQKINISEASVGQAEYTDSKLTLNNQKLMEYLKTIKIQIDQPVQEPLFNVENTADPNKPRIKEFRAPEDGLELDIPETAASLSQALLTQNQQIVALAVKVTTPKNKLANDLGIKELIGRGESDFGGSIEGRIYNVGLAASRINGVLISPGETFSFDQTIGDVTAATGYKQAYVIKSGRTVLDDGGGVCQVSTTLFRAVLNSGMPVVERTAHAYRVHYYEEGGYAPGIDATIFYPSVDFKFKNDTDHSILLQSYVNGLHLTVDMYGTSDGRVATVSKPVILSQTPPPPDLRQDDPTLPKGTVKQVDFSAWGANVVFSRTVQKNGVNIINESFRSNYRPWQAIYLVGTKEG